LREDPVVVFCGNQQQVNQGFAIALRVMGIDPDFLRGRIPPTTNHPTRRTTNEHQNLPYGFDSCGFPHFGSDRAGD
jgi:hypothetical protein